MAHKAPRLPQAADAHIRARFMRFVSKESNGCWLWQGAKDATGYGCFQYNSDSQRKAHRVAYEFFVGPIPDGLQIDHLCRVRHCVNPIHLEPVTHQENIARGWASRRSQKEPRKRVVVHIPISVNLAAKIEAARLRISKSELIEATLRDFLKMKEVPHV